MFARKNKFKSLLDIVLLIQNFGCKNPVNDDENYNDDNNIDK